MALLCIFSTAKRSHVCVVVFLFSSFSFYFLEMWGWREKSRERKGLKMDAFDKPGAASDQAWPGLPRPRIPPSASSIALASWRQTCLPLPPHPPSPRTEGCLGSSLQLWGEQGSLQPRAGVPQTPVCVPSVKRVMWELTQSPSCGEARKPVVSRIGFYF